MPDMHIVVNGISIEAELKAPKGKPNDLQIQKLNQIDDAGCISVVLYPKDFEKFKNLVGFIKRNYFCSADVVTFSGLERGWRK